MKKIIALLLSAALCAGLLAGCGDKEQPEQEQAQQPTEEVYVSAFTPLGFPEGTSPDIWALAGEEIYAASYEKLADGQVPEGKTLDYEGQYDVMGYRLYRAAADGAVAALDY